MKQTLKNGFAMLLCLAMLLTLLPQMALPSSAATYSGSCGADGDNLIWTLDLYAKHLVISGIGEMRDYSDLDAPWLARADSITSVRIEKGVTSIGGYAFHGLTKLVNITISDTVTSIGEFAFNACYVLKAVNLPNTVTSIGKYAFCNCLAMEEFVLPTGATKVSQGMLTGCKNLSQITLHAGVTSIGKYAFSGTAIETLAIPEGVAQISEGTFASCSNLTSVTIPDSVISIGKQAFYKCTGLTEFLVPVGVVEICYYAFYQCSSLNKIIIKNPLCDIFADYRTLGNYKETTIYGFAGSTAESYATSCGYSFAEILSENADTCQHRWTPALEVSAATCTKEGTNAYVCYACSVVRTESLPALGRGHAPFEVTVTEPTCTKDGYTTYTCTGCRESYTADPVPGGHLWDEGTVAWEPTETEPGVIVYTCTRCASSMAEYIPALGSGEQDPDEPEEDPIVAFPVEGGYIYFNKETGTIISCDNTVTSAVIPNEINSVSVTSIEKAAFSHCESLIDVTVPDSVTSIGEYAFEYCTALESITLSNNIKGISRGLFYLCTALKDIVIPSCVTSIGDNAFFWCDALVGIDIPDGVKSIGMNAFQGCASLSFVAIPKSIMTIDREAFDNNKNLHVLYAGKQEQWESIDLVFGNSPLLDGVIHFESNGTEIYWASAEYGKYLYCSICNQALTPIPECLHRGTELRDAKEPSCTEAGYTGDTWCLICGKNIAVGTVLAPLDHNWDNGTVTTLPTATENGVKTYICTRCGETKTESIPALGHTHSYAESIVAPTCREQGYTRHTCACGDSYIDSYVAAPGHAWNDGAVTVQPTATTDGVKTYTCTRCAETKTESIPATGEGNKSCDGGTACPSAHFTDVAGPSNWAHKGIDYAVQNGLFNGMTATTFAPDVAMTRAMLVTVLWRYAGEPKEGTNSFSDVPNGKYYTDAVAWAAHNGVVTGIGNNKFDPDGKITREQMATILYRYATKNGIDTSARADLSGFPDADKVSKYAKEALQWAVAEGLVTGSKVSGVTYLQPKGSATRAQVATILMRFIENIVNK